MSISLQMLSHSSSDWFILLDGFDGTVGHFLPFHEGHSMNQFRPSSRAFIVALLATLVLGVLRHVIFIPIFELPGRVMPSCLAVMLAASVGGLKAGLFATALNAGLLAWADEEMGRHLLAASGSFRLVTFVALSGLTSWGIEALHGARQRVEDWHRERENELSERRKTEASEREQRQRHALIEAQLRESEERIRLAVEAAEIGPWDFDPVAGKLRASVRCKELFGIPPYADVDLAGFVSRIHPEDQESMKSAMQVALDAKGNGNYETEYRVVWNDGTIRWLIAKGQAYFEGEGRDRRTVRFIGIVIDITDRKRASEALIEEQEMLRHTIEVQDQERQLIAYEIHDGLVQYATGALMQLESLQDQMKHEPVAERIAHVVDVLRKTVDEGRRIINGIHTTVLDDCGVVAAIQQLVEDEERAHVQVEFVNDEEVGRMAPNIELALYHITQEALTNVRKHSQSEKVRVTLCRREDRVQLEVRDWGVGFVQTANSPGVHGLRGMAARAAIAGGTCTVQKAQGKGSQVIVDLPYLNRN